MRKIGARTRIPNRAKWTANVRMIIAVNGGKLITAVLLTNLSKEPEEDDRPAERGGGGEEEKELCVF
jgi:hypothetical protein